MPRKLRVEYPGAIYHVMNRGDRREPIFRDDADRKLFLATLGECCGKTDWQVHAWCLMLNHFHLVVEAPKANLVAGMKWFLGTYTARFNRRHKLFGHLFSGALQGLGGGRLGQWVSKDGLRLRPPESGAGEIAGGGAVVEGVSVEQLSGLPQGGGGSGSEMMKSQLCQCLGPTRVRPGSLLIIDTNPARLVFGG